MLTWTAPTAVQHNDQFSGYAKLRITGKTYLFAGGGSRGERAVSIYTLIGTELLCGVNPEAWFRHVLERISDLPINRVHELLPWHVKGKLSADNPSA